MMKIAFMNLLSNEKATFIVITMDTLNISGNIFYSRWEEKYFQYITKIAKFLFELHTTFL
jgi:hypothetical protein